MASAEGRLITAEAHSGGDGSDSSIRAPGVRVAQSSQRARAQPRRLAVWTLVPMLPQHRDRQGRVRPGPHLPPPRTRTRPPAGCPFQTIPALALLFCSCFPPALWFPGQHAACQAAPGPVVRCHLTHVPLPWGTCNGARPMWSYALQTPAACVHEHPYLLSSWSMQPSLFWHGRYYTPSWSLCLGCYTDAALHGPTPAPTSRLSSARRQPPPLVATLVKRLLGNSMYKSKCRSRRAPHSSRKSQSTTFQ